MTISDDSTPFRVRVQADLAFINIADRGFIPGKGLKASLQGIYVPFFEQPVMEWGKAFTTTQESGDLAT
jgi:hypothetical protein